MLGLARLLTSAKRMRAEWFTEACGAARVLATGLGLGEAVLMGLDEVYERWDAAGGPRHLGGMDILAIRDATARAVDRARKDKTPTLLEARTYRFRGHSMRDPAGAVYRTKEEVEREKLRDPIVLFRDKAVAAGVLTDADVRALEKDVNDIIDEAVAFADASPEPPSEWLFTDIYKD